MKVRGNQVASQRKKRDPLIGELLGGKYRIDRLVARGGMGAVYVAVQEPLGRDVAVKVLKHTSTVAEIRDIDEKRFFREASTASRLKHPNTVIIHDYGVLEDHEGLYLVMEYLQGQTLSEVQAISGTLTWERALPIIRQIAGSMGEAHDQGLVHRDLKPLNVMLLERAGEADFVKVLDFGLAKPVRESVDEQVTEQGAIMGSPIYMSPEQIFSEPLDHRTDIYALGVLCYEILTGRPPFVVAEKGKVSDLLRSHLVGIVPEMRSINPNLDLADHVEFAILRCLAKKAKDRFDSMDEFLAALSSGAAPKKETGEIGFAETADYSMQGATLPEGADSQGGSATGDHPVSTTKLGSNDSLEAARPRRGSGLIALAAVLAIGVALAVVFSGSEEESPERGDEAAQKASPAGQTPNTEGATPKTLEPAKVPVSRVKADKNSAPPAVTNPGAPVVEPVVATKITVHFSSKPAGASVWRDGKRLGSGLTPFELALDKDGVAGSYQFRKSGYGSTSKSVEVAAGKARVEVNVQLRRAAKDRRRGSRSPLHKTNR